MGCGFPVEVRTAKTGLWGNTKEIVRVVTEECAQQLVLAITEAWAAGETLFNADDWLKEHSFDVWSPDVSSSEPDQPEELEKLIEGARQCHQSISETNQKEKEIQKHIEDLGNKKNKQNTKKTKFPWATFCTGVILLILSLLLKDSAMVIGSCAAIGSAFVLFALRCLLVKKREREISAVTALLREEGKK